MKKLLITILVCLAFVGCGTKDLRKINVVLKEHKLDKCNCQFDLDGDSSPNDWISRTKNAIYFIDSCSKYDVGDTIIFLK